MMECGARLSPIERATTRIVFKGEFKTHWASNQDRSDFS